MELTVEQIAQLVGGRVQGNASQVIRGAAGLQEATSQDIAFLKDASNTKVINDFGETKAGAVIVPTGTPKNGKTLVEVENPLAAFAKVLGLISEEKTHRPAGVHPQASVAKSAKIGKNVSIGPFCIVEDEAQIDDDCCLMGQVYVGRRSRLGGGSTLYPHVVVREEVTIGSRCIIHAGAVIGSDGYGFYFSQGRHNKIPQVGTVVVEDDVEIGSCSTIDRATTGATRIGRGTKIDNLVQVAHNVQVGPHCLLVAQVGIGGSTRIGTGVVLAGQVGVADHVTIGDGAQVGAQSGLKEDVPDKAVLFGSPAQPFQDTVRQMLLIRRLPELFKQVKELKEKFGNHE